MSTILSFKSIKNKLDVYRAKDSLEMFCESLREHPLKIIIFKKKKKELLTKEQQESYLNANICYVCIEKFESNFLKDKKYRKVRDHCHYTEKYRGLVHSICHLKYSAPEKFQKFFIIDLTMIIILS